MSTVETALVLIAIAQVGFTAYLAERLLVERDRLTRLDHITALLANDYEERIKRLEKGGNP